MYFCASSNRFSDINVSNFVTFKKYDMVVEYSCPNDAIRWQMQNIDVKNLFQ